MTGYTTFHCIVLGSGRYSQLAPKTVPALPPRSAGGIKIKDEPVSRPPRKQQRGGGVCAPAPRRELMEEEAKAQYDRDIAEAICQSIDTGQPPTVEYAEVWSARQVGIFPGAFWGMPRGSSIRRRPDLS